MDCKLAEDFQKALDYVNAADNNIYQPLKYFCYNEEQKKVIKQYVPDADVVILPQRFVECNPDKDKIYVIPMDDVKPIKFVFEDDNVTRLNDGTYKIEKEI